MILRRLGVILCLMLLTVASAHAQAYQCVQPTCVQLQYGQTVSGNVPPNGVPVEYAFTGNQGDVVTVTMNRSSTTLDPIIEMYLEGDALVAENDDTFGLNAALIDFTLPQTGTYVIVPVGFENTYGTFDLTLTRAGQGGGGAVGVTSGSFATPISSNARVYSGAGTNNQLVGRLRFGQRYPVIGQANGWVNVDFNGFSGWVSQQFVSVSGGLPSGVTVQPGGSILPNPGTTRLLTGGIGLTSGQQVGPGEFQVEYFCTRRGLIAQSDPVNWFCINDRQEVQYTLTQADFNTICQETYRNPVAFAAQTGASLRPAYNWRCYG